MDTLLLTYPGEAIAPTLKNNSKYVLLMKIKDLIVKLLEKQRKSINVDHTEFNWNPNFDKLPGFTKSLASNMYGSCAIYPIHNTLKTENKFDTNRQFLQLHCKQLHDLAQMYGNFFFVVVVFNRQNDFNN